MNLSRTRTASIAAIIATALALSACTSDVSDLERAQAQVAAKETAVADAEAAFTAASDAFCSASTDYITTLDAYGDILTDTAPTVGDVRNGGADLVAPRDDAFNDAAAAVSAQQQLTTAQQELVDAKVALDAIAASPSGTPTLTASTVPQPEALAPEATVERVKQAEKDFADTSADITDDTPLREAAEVFHSAAVALELSWLRLFVESGCASEEQEARFSEEATAYTKALQKDLTALEYYDGEIDGIYGPATTKAVEDLQKAHDLPVTGTMDMATAEALQDDMVEKGLATAQESLATTAAVQQTLKLLGYWDEPIDGVWSDELTEAVKDFQEDLGVEPTGEVDAATVAAFEKAIADFKASLEEPEESPEPEPSESPTPEPTSSE